MLNISVDNPAMLSETESQRPLVERNDTETEILNAVLIHSMFEAQVAQAPDRIAVYFGGESLTYTQLNHNADCLAQYLVGLGIKPGSLIGLQVERSFAMMTGLLGILKAGCCYVPLDPAFPAERLSYMCKDAQVALLITQESLSEKLAFPEDRIVRLDCDWPQIESNFQSTDLPDVGTAAWHDKIGIKPEDLAYVIYTSGSTGRPKGVMIPHRAAVNFLQTMALRPGLVTNDILLAVTTLSFDIALLELFLPLTVGAQVVIASRAEATDAQLLMALLEQHDISIMQATPATWRMIFDAGWQGNPGLRVLCGGEPFPVDLAQQLLDSTAAVWNMYGPTETTVWSTIHQLESASAPIPIGHPIDNTEIYILDESLQPVSVGVPGLLYIGGIGLAHGYLNQPDLTAEKFIPHPFDEGSDTRLYNTGDLAQYRSDCLIECLGRIDHQVKIRGYRIELGEIESCLSEHPNIAQSVVVAREDSRGNKILVAYNKVRRNDPEMKNGELAEAMPPPSVLRTFLKDKLPNYMIPTAFVFLAALPLTPNGKIDRNALASLESLSTQNKSGVVAPRTETEATLIELWAKEIDLPDIGIHDNFFDIGGTSLIAVRILAQIESTLGKRLPLSALLEAPTVSELCTLLEQCGESPLLEPLVKMKQGTDPERPPIFLCHGAGGAVLLYRTLAEHLPPEQTVYGIQAIGLDARLEPHHTIEEMVDLYLPKIKSVQPNGPYLLCGYCMGGTIVFELAQRLTAMGNKVELLALLETYNWHKGDAANGSLRTKDKLRHVYEKIEFHLRNLILSDASGKGRFFKEKLDELTRRIKMVRTNYSKKAQLSNNEQELDGHLAADERIHIGDDVAFATTSRVWAVNDAASLTYRPKTYPDRILHIITRKEYSCYAKSEMMWDQIAKGGVEKVVLNVYPAGMLIEPFVTELAETLRINIDRALDEDAPSASVGDLHNGMKGTIVQEGHQDAHRIAV